MAATDILSIEEGREAIGLDADDDSLDTPLAMYVSAATSFIDGHMFELAVIRDVDGTDEGRYADTSAVPADIKLACTAALQEMWRLYKGTPNSGFDDVGAPYLLPARIMQLIPGEWEAGIS